MNITLDTLRKEEEVALRLRSLYESFGYKKYKMAKFEEYGFYIENKNFLQSNQIIAFNDADGRLMALKPDVTLSIVKNTNATANVCEKLYYSENVYRMNTQGREYKEISQTGLEFIGNITPRTTLEIVMLAAKSLEVIHERYILDISHMGYIMGMLDSLISDVVLKENVINCIRKKNVHELEKLCLGAGLSEYSTEKIKALVTLSGPFGKTLEEAKKYILNDEMANAVGELEKISCADDGSFRLDFSIINDMNYYNGIVFRGFVTVSPREYSRADNTTV
jgi:ATP phosphoribosyltransferase regulatory subunit